MTTQTLTPFPCTACGKCCRLVGNNAQTSFLDRGDGVCRYLNEQTKLCTIYETRPLVCRVEDYYRRYLADQISWDKFVRINLEICEKL